jgi:hypothetical protein
MNERIKELAIEAQVEHCVSHVRLEEFADLIIQEAILAVESKTNTNHIYTTFDQGMVSHTINNSVKAIKEHFGLKS